MEEDSIIRLLQLLGSPKIRSSGRNVVASCPLAEWTHKNGTDRHPSFTVKIDSSGSSVYNCYACGHKGSLFALVEEYKKFAGGVPGTAESLAREDGNCTVQRKYSQYKNMFGKDILVGLKKKDEEVWDEEELSGCRGQLHQYILDRGIKKDVCKRWEVGYDKDEGMLVLPVRRRSDEKLVGALGRSVDTNAFYKHMNYLNFKKGDYLYGEHFLVEAGKPTMAEGLGFDLPAVNGVILVEGTLDTLFVNQVGYDNVCGALTDGITDKQANTLKALGRPVYLALDWDRYGIACRVGVAKKLLGRVPVYNVCGVVECSNCGGRWPKVDKTKVPESFVCSSCGADWLYDPSKKDPDSLTQTEFIDCLENAREIRGIKS